LLSKRSAYHLVGKIQPEFARELAALAADHRVNLIVSGEVDDATLANAIVRADVISCLRWPNIEAASASAIEALLYGKATIVNDTGFFRELPGSIVRKVDLGNEIPSIQLALEHLSVDSSERNQLEMRAKAWARSTFTVENYALQLVEVGKATARSNPQIAAVHHFVDLMARWNASENLMRLDDTIAPLSRLSDSHG
jgi:hypothetical protein